MILQCKVTSNVVCHVLEDHKSENGSKVDEIALKQLITQKLRRSVASLLFYPVELLQDEKNVLLCLFCRVVKQSSVLSWLLLSHEMRCETPS